MAIIAVLFIFAIIAGVYPNQEGLGSLVFGVGSRPVTWAMIVLAFVGIVMTAGFVVKGRWDGVFIDRDNRISLSRFQLVVWSTLLLGSLFAAGASNAVNGAVTGGALEIVVPSEILALLGLSTLSAIGAPLIKENKRRDAKPNSAQAVVDMVKTAESLNAAPDFEGRVMRKSTEIDARWRDILLGDYEGAGFVDVSKLQQLAFTVLLVVVYAVGLTEVMKGSGQIDEFPTVSTGFLALLGISHAAYLADKQLGDS